MPKLRFLQSETGTAAIELAAIAPVLVVLLLGTADLGLAMFKRLQVQSAAQAGAQLAATAGFDVQAITTAVQTATQNSSIAANPAPTNFCGCPSATAVTVVACGTTVCPSGVLPGSYVKVSASYTYTPLLRYAPITMSVHTTVRIR